MDSKLEEILAHHGVKGMKWGVRKNQAVASIRSHSDRIKGELASRSSSEVTVRTAPGRGVRTVGGVKRMAHPDAVRARTSHQIAKKSTVDALSTKDLQELITRMNLEKQFRDLSKGEDRSTAGEKLVKSLLNEHGDSAINALGKTRFAPAAGAAKVAFEQVQKRTKK